MTLLIHPMKHLRICTDILIGTKIAFDQIPCLFMIKILNRTGI